MKKILLVLILIIGLSLFVGCGNDSEDTINIVRNGELYDFPGIEFGKVVDSFIGDPKWEAITGEDGNTYVNLYGVVIFEDADVDILIQYKVDKEEETFTLKAFEMNKVPQDITLYSELIITMYEEYE